MRSVVIFEKVFFKVASERVSGVLARPLGDDPVPGVVLAGPRGGRKEQWTGWTARALASQGIAALAFDHRNWGNSQGHPRHTEVAETKIEDLRAAASSMARHPAIDPAKIALCGTDYGAGYAAHAAVGHLEVAALISIRGVFHHPGVALVVDQSGFLTNDWLDLSATDFVAKSMQAFDDWQQNQAASPYGKLWMPRFMARAQEAQERYEATGKPFPITQSWEGPHGMPGMAMNMYDLYCDHCQWPTDAILPFISDKKLQSHRLKAHKSGATQVNERGRTRTAFEEYLGDYSLLLEGSETSDPNLAVPDKWHGFRSGERVFLPITDISLFDIVMFDALSAAPDLRVPVTLYDDEAEFYDDPRRSPYVHRNAQLFADLVPGSVERVLATRTHEGISLLPQPSGATSDQVAAIVQAMSDLD